MDCTPENPTLLTIAFSNVAIILWNQEDIRELICNYSIEFGEWSEISEKVKLKASKLATPDSLKKCLINAVQKVGCEIRHWLTRHGENLDVDDTFINTLTNKLCWTPNGAIDRKKTAETLAGDETIDLGFRYRLSCFYSLEDFIRELWSRMDADEHMYENDLCDLNMYERRFTTFWTFYMQGQLHRLEYDIKRYDPDNTPFEYAFQCAAEHVNETAMTFFWEKLTHSEKEKYIQMAQDTGVVCFLISVMTKEQQWRVLKSWPYKVLDSLLFWPRMDLFCRAARCVWNYLDEQEYHKLLINMTSSCAYPFEVFEMFWKEAPESHRKNVLRNPMRVPLLVEMLLKCSDEDNFKLVLKEYSDDERDDVIFGSTGIALCAKFISKGRWDCFKMFAVECLSSKQAILQLEDDVEDHLSTYGRYFEADVIERWEEYKAKFFVELGTLLDKKLNITS